MGSGAGPRNSKGQIHQANQYKPHWAFMMEEQPRTPTTDDTTTTTTDKSSEDIIFKQEAASHRHCYTTRLCPQTATVCGCHAKEGRRKGCRSCRFWTPPDPMNKAGARTFYATKSSTGGPKAPKEGPRSMKKGPKDRGVALSPLHYLPYVDGRRGRHDDDRTNEERSRLQEQSEQHPISECCRLDPGRSAPVPGVPRVAP